MHSPAFSFSRPSSVSAFAFSPLPSHASDSARVCAPLSQDTLDFLSKYDTLAFEGLPLEFVQNKAPKVDASDLSPASWPANPSHEWCPPGHGDLYPAMVGSGALDMLIAKGFKYMFVSNSDNLGATMDLKLL
eukprot:3189496-Pleurochrysis_carterae.AAC.1